MTCNGGHAECTADTKFVDSFNKYEIGKYIREQLTRKDTFVKYVPIDRDGQSAAGIAAAMKVMDPTKTGRSNAPDQAQFLECLKANFSQDMFCTVATLAKKTKMQKVLSMDIKTRSFLVFKE